jgi:SAM-dependent methyltransferase
MHTLSSLCLAPFLAVLPLQSKPADASAPRPVAVLRQEAERLRPLVQTAGARAFLDATVKLPEIEPRIVYEDAKTHTALTPEEHALKPAAERAAFTERTLGEDFYYLTKYGTPLAYARVVDLLCRLEGDDATLAGKRLLDFGYGGIGHLRLLSSAGSTVVGVEVDPLLRAFYRPSDQTPTLRLVHGSWPGDAATREAAGEGFDVIVSKNTLKRGYVRPSQKVDPRMLVDLGVTPPEFLAAVARALKPGGLFAIYNICPAQKPDRYIPWAEGQSPFTLEEFAAAGFAVLAFDVDDTAAVREMAFALGWEEQGMDLENDLFAWYTIVRKPG